MYAFIVKVVGQGWVPANTWAEIFFILFSPKPQGLTILNPFAMDTSIAIASGAFGMEYTALKEDSSIFAAINADIKTKLPSHQSMLS